MTHNVSRQMGVLALMSVAVLAVGILAAVACGGGDDGGNGDGSMIGLDGGEVSLEGGAEINIPAGAVDDGEISVQISKSDRQPSLPESFNIVGDVYEIGPEGATFATPVRVALPIPEGEDAEDVVGLVTLDPDSGEWAMLSSVVDADAGTVSAFTTHLSPFGIVGGRSEADKTGGWIRVTNTYVRGSLPYPGGKRLPMHLENVVCITNYAPTNPALLVRPSLSAIVATPYWGWTVGTPPTVVEYWLPAGTYTVEDSKAASEINTNPDYVPVYTWWTRPPQTVVLTPGMVVDFGEDIESPPSPSSGFVEMPNACAGVPRPTGTPTGQEPTGTPAGQEPTGTPTAQEEIFFKVNSIGGAYNGATAEPTFTIDSSWLVTRIVNYHWNNGEGATPGTIGLSAADGTTYGPWQAFGAVGEGTIPDPDWAPYWAVTPDIVIPPGTYTVLDSDHSTWAQNDETGGVGMTRVHGILQNGSGSSPTPDCPTTASGYPDIAGAWVEVSGFPSNGHPITVTQSDATYTAVGSYAIGGTDIAYRTEGTLTRDGVITERLVHTEGVSPGDPGFTQDRRMTLTQDCSTLDISAETVGGGDEHQLSWRRASP